MVLLVAKQLSDGHLGDQAEDTTVTHYPCIPSHEKAVLDILLL